MFYGHLYKSTVRAGHGPRRLNFNDRSKMSFHKFSALLSLFVAAQAAPSSVTDTWSGTHWHKYVRSPDSSIVKPQSIISANTTGNVKNPGGLLGGSGPTIFSRESHDTVVPQVVIDFGLNVVGLPIIHFEGSESIEEGLPGLRLAFSEVLEALADKSDYTRSYRGVHEARRCIATESKIAC